MIMNFNEYKAKVFSESPDVKEEYEALAPQYALIQAEIERQKITQIELTERIGTVKAITSRLESGS